MFCLVISFFSFPCDFHHLALHVVVIFLSTSCIPIGFLLRLLAFFLFLLVREYFLYQFSLCSSALLLIPLHSSLTPFSSLQNCNWSSVWLTQQKRYYFRNFLYFIYSPHQVNKKSPPIFTSVHSSSVLIKHNTGQTK